MATVVEAPQWLRSKSGEIATEQMMRWVCGTRQKLLRAMPPAEKAFRRIIDGIQSRMQKWKTRLHYTPQKQFLVADSVVFFGDFYFGGFGDKPFADRKPPPADRKPVGGPPGARRDCAWRDCARCAGGADVRPREVAW